MLFFSDSAWEEGLEPFVAEYRLARAMPIRGQRAVYPFAKKPKMIAKGIRQPRPVARPQRMNADSAEIRDAIRIRMLSGILILDGVEAAERSLRKPNDICPAT